METIRKLWAALAACWSRLFGLGIPEADAPDAELPEDGSADAPQGEPVGDRAGHAIDGGRELAPVSDAGTSGGASTSRASGGRGARRYGLLSDGQLAELIGYSGATSVSAARARERRDPQDRIPAWVDSSHSETPKCLGTTPESLKQWMARHPNPVASTAQDAQNPLQEEITGMDEQGHGEGSVRPSEGPRARWTEARLAAYRILRAQAEGSEMGVDVEIAVATAAGRLELTLAEVARLHAIMVSVVLDDDAAAIRDLAARTVRNIDFQLEATRTPKNAAQLAAEWQALHLETAAAQGGAA